MTSGKQAKRRCQAQKPPPPPVRRQPGARRASPKVLLVAAAVLALAGAGAGIGLALSGGSSPKQVPLRGSLVGALPGAARVEALFKGIPQRANVLGARSAPVKIVEYIDLQCPFC